MGVGGGLGSARGVVRLVDTSGRGVLCLAGDVDEQVVAEFHAGHGHEPHPVDAVDAGSVTALSPAALDLLLDHLDAAARQGRDIPVRRSPAVTRLLATARRT